MASTISAGTTSATALNLTGDTTGNLAFQTGAGANTITVPNSTGTVALTSDVIGVSQTWQDLTASRAAGTTYYNTTGKPIMVSVKTNWSISSGIGMALQINSVEIAMLGGGGGQAASSGAGTIGTIIPASAAYLITTASGYAAGSVSYWRELR
jgi:hypothetical protein